MSSSEIESLLTRAFHSGPAEQANQLIADVREAVTTHHGSAVNYEVVPGGRGLAYLEQTVAPRLALFLKSKRMGVHGCAAAFLSIFVGDTLYFVAAPDFYGYLKELRGYSDDAFRVLAETWERTGRGAVAALPSGEIPS